MSSQHRVAVMKTVSFREMKLTTSVRARKLARKHGLDWTGVLTLIDIAQCDHERIRCFREQQLEPGHQRSKGNSN